MKSNLGAVAIGLLLILGIGFLLWQIMTLFFDYIKSKSHDKLRSDIEKAIANGKPSWTQIKLIESTYPMLITNSLQINLKKILKGKILEGTENNCEGILLLEKWLENLRSDEPFEGISSELRLPLERIRKEVPEHQHLLETLVAQLQEFGQKSQAEKKRKNVMSVMSLVFGIVGVLVGVYPIYATSSQDHVSPRAIESTQHALPE